MPAEPAGQLGLDRVGGPPRPLVERVAGCTRRSSTGSPGRRWRTRSPRSRSRSRPPPSSGPACRRLHRAEAQSVTRSITASVRSSDAPSGSWTLTTRYPWSCCGMNPPGTDEKPRYGQAEQPDVHDEDDEREPDQPADRPPVPAVTSVERPVEPDEEPAEEPVHRPRQEVPRDPGRQHDGRVPGELRHRRREERPEHRPGLRQYDRPPPTARRPRAAAPPAGGAAPARLVALGPQEERAEGRAERQRVERRDQVETAMVTANWLEELPGQPRDERGRDEHRGQHQLTADHRPGHLGHRLPGRVRGAQPALDVVTRPPPPRRSRRPPRCRWPGRGRTGSGC